jgi:hypothetical protein
MSSLLTILAVGITVVVPAAVWAFLVFGLFELVRDWVHKRQLELHHRQVARTTRS